VGTVCKKPDTALVAWELAPAGLRSRPTLLGPLRAPAGASSLATGVMSFGGASAALVEAVDVGSDFFEVCAVNGHVDDASEQAIQLTWLYENPMWEGACPRWLSVSHCIGWLVHRYREQAPLCLEPGLD
jgi:hypothetical protein